MREILGRRAKTKKKLHQSRRRGCVLWCDVLNRSLDRGQEQHRGRTEVGYDIFLCRRTDVTSVDPASIRRCLQPRLHPARHQFPNYFISTVPQIGPLLQTIGNQDNASEGLSDLLLFVLFLYMIRCPHSRQRMGSRGLMSFLAPQSSVFF